MDTFLYQWGDFLVVGFNHLIVEVHSPHKQIIIVDACWFLDWAVSLGDFHVGVVVN